MKSIFLDRRILILLGFMVLINVAMVTFGSARSLDVMPYYTGDQARALLQSFSAIQLEKYFVCELLDLIFLTTYTIALVIAYRTNFVGRGKLLALAIAPGFFDLIETSSILYALKTVGPHLFFDWLGVVTFLKWLTGLIAFIVLVIDDIRRSRSLL